MKWRWLLTILFFLASCSEQTTGASGNFEPDDAGLDTFVPSETDSTSADTDATDVSAEPYSIWTDPCIDCDWYFCPPLDSVWQKHICINNCDDPPTVAYESPCIEHLDCDPTQPIMEVEIPCFTEDGLPGSQDKICNKGQIQYTSCVTECRDEECNGTDDDCDEMIDEGFEGIEEECNNIDEDCDNIVDEGSWECDEGCGPGPNLCVAGEFACLAPLPGEEMCDYMDNDCDDLIDEGQLNTCEQCGPDPEEICDNIDNDCDGYLDEDLYQPCGTACGEGYETCFEGNWVSCTAPPVSEEVCDGVDNDCDGQIDEELECICTIQDVGALFPCQESPLLCGKGYKTCECLDVYCKTITTTPCYAICHWLAQPPGTDLTCDSYTGQAIAQEDCNNFDDDCDLAIDEDIYAGCYTGPEGTLGVGICIPGEMTCDIGVWGHYNEQNNFLPGFCKDEITPQTELCNGEDDDCNGETDWGYELPDTDILFIVDWSGSMSDEISATLTALNKFAQTYSDEEVLQWAAILGPRPTPASNYGEVLELYHNLSGFSDFLSAMASLNLYSLYGSREMLLDALYLAVHNITTNLTYPISDLKWAAPYAVEESIPELENFKVDWRPKADKVIILFTDEPEQSYLIPQLVVNDIMAAVASSIKLKVYIFSNSESYSWDEIAQAGNGKYFDLTSNPTQMYNSLMEILDDICKTGGNNAE